MGGLAMSKTLLKKLFIKKFRALNNVDIEFGTHVTVICGKNGTSKSSILSIAAQIFSFEKDYLKDERLQFQTITGSKFKSLPAEHFRFSDKINMMCPDPWMWQLSSMTAIPIAMLLPNLNYRVEELVRDQLFGRTLQQRRGKKAEISLTQLFF
jgi:ABC-type phosphate transport system ATPase subunit